MNYNFQKVYWGDSKHTSVIFQPFEKIPQNVHPTACMVFVTDKESVLMVKSKRGWGLPGGHIEPEETPEQCATREVHEEASIEISDLKLVGGWITAKEFHTDDNQKYPDHGVMLLYAATTKRIDKFVAMHETSERKFVAYSEIMKVHDGRSDFYEVCRYIINEKTP